MSLVDWAIVVGYLVWMVADGLKRSHRTDEMEGYFLASRSLPWWAAGLSVMATQLSAITLVGTTGQEYATGLRFVQFYFGLPLAMIILSVTVVPFFHRARVYTAYEYLERRFDLRTRTATSFLFLVGRAFSLGVTLAAPAVVMSAIVGWSVPMTVLVIAVPMVVYTGLGGVQAVAWTDVKQMAVVVLGLFATIGVLVYGITTHVGFGEAMALVGKAGIDKHQYLDILTSTLFGAPVYKTYGGLIADAKFEPAGFAAPLGLKDIRLALAAGDELRVPLPLASLLRDRYLTLLANGGDKLDWSAIGGLAAKDAGAK